MIIITGQTATGKTKLALEYARKYNGELINCDSRQIYKYLDIITGKDFTEKNFKPVKKVGKFNIGYYNLKVGNTDERVSVWLYDIVKPDQHFSSFDFTTCARFVINEIISRGKTPIIVGGSYLYIKHLLYGFDTETIPPDWELRKKLENKTVTELQKILKSLSRSAIKQLNNSDLNNPQRLIRKIEIAKYYKSHPELTLPAGRQVSGSGSRIKFGMTDIKKFIGIKYKNKNDLKKAITKRVAQRIKSGAFEEVQGLLNKDFKESDPGLRTIGYQQIIKFLNGKSTKDIAINQWTTKELQYAKRQSTFMKTDKNIEWKFI